MNARLDTNRFWGVVCTLVKLQRVAPLKDDPAERWRQCAARILVSNDLEAYQTLARQAQRLGIEQTASWLRDFDQHYWDPYHAGQRDVSPLLQLITQLSEPIPNEGPLEEDLSETLLTLAVELTTCLCQDYQG
jgi:hypothetical protein